MKKSDYDRIVITGIGLVSPCGNTLTELRNNVLSGKSGVTFLNVPFMGEKPAGICNFDSFKYQTKKMQSRGTRSGSIGIYCANEALLDSGVNLEHIDRSKIGIFLGLAEHGNAESEKELLDFFTINEQSISYWSHLHIFKSIINSPAGEISVNLKITGPHFAIGAACASGNLGIIQGVQQILLGEVDYALAGGVSEATNAFGTFASFAAQGALAQHSDADKSCRPLDSKRNGVVIAEGGGIFLLERMSSAKARGARVYAEIAGYHYNSDAGDYLLPSAEREVECMNKALLKSRVAPSEVDLINLHATGTISGDIQECIAIRAVFGQSSETYINSTKGFLGHAMGAASTLEIAANILSFEDDIIHSSLNVENLDPECELNNFVYQGNISKKNIKYILKNSFGMMGLNSTIILKKVENN